MSLRLFLKDEQTNLLLIRLSVNEVIVSHLRNSSPVNIRVCL